MSFGIYLCGFVVMIVGLALGAYFLHIPAHWIGTGVVVLPPATKIHPLEENQGTGSLTVAARYGKSVSEPRP
jgi:hypothetical protein